eukprot:GHVT01071408.1.p1 GENE.GHVT01071408.1~~GHVT01071408.1.p1  ORF type:complete len:206 (+),score=8.79 GHVT01071408.1:295-912(+)
MSAPSKILSRLRPALHSQRKRPLRPTLRYGMLTAVSVVLFVGCCTIVHQSMNSARRGLRDGPTSVPFTSSASVGAPYPLQGEPQATSPTSFDNPNSNNGYSILPSFNTATILPVGFSNHVPKMQARFSLKDKKVGIPAGMFLLSCFSIIGLFATLTAYCRSPDSDLGRRTLAATIGLAVFCTFETACAGYLLHHRYAEILPNRQP